MTTQLTTCLLPFGCRLKWKHLLVAMIFYFGGSYFSLQAQSFSENFDDITLLPGNGWALVNASSPLGITDWFQGASGVFPAYNGVAAAYIGANFYNTSGTGTISNWLMSPVRTFNNGDVISFYTRTNVNPSAFPDRLRLMLSTNGSSTAIASFTTTLLSVNAGLTTSGYPSVWTQYTATLSGLPMGGVSGRFALWYDVPNGGDSGSNADYIGIDEVVYSSMALSTPVVLNCPTNTTVTACQTQAAVNTSFANWLATASASGGCNGVLTNNNTGAPSACGGSTTVTFTYTSTCAPLTTTCNATFTVAAAPTVVLTCPTNTTAAACQTQAAVDAAFRNLACHSKRPQAAAMALFPTTIRVRHLPVAASTTVTFTYTSTCSPLTIDLSGDLHGSGTIIPYTCICQLYEQHR
jgi:hypothetical protein